MSQSEIARLSGIPQPRLSKWIGGAVPNGADAALRLQAVEAILVKTKRAQKGRARARGRDGRKAHVSTVDSTGSKGLQTLRKRLEGVTE